MFTIHIAGGTSRGPACRGRRKPSFSRCLKTFSSIPQMSGKCFQPRDNIFIHRLLALTAPRWNSCGTAPQSQNTLQTTISCVLYLCEPAISAQIFFERSHAFLRQLMIRYLRDRCYRSVRPQGEPLSNRRDIECAEFEPGAN